MNGRRPLTATPAPKREIRFAPLSWKAPHLPPRLEGVAESVPLALTVACSRIRSGPVSPSLRRQAYGRGCWAFHPQGDKATVVRVLVCRERFSAVGAGCFNAGRQGSGLRRHRPGGFVREAAMTKMGPAAAVRRCISPRVRSRHSTLAGCSSLQPMTPATPTHKDHEIGIEAEA